MDKIINNLFKYIKRDNFLIDFTQINPKGGIAHRGSGKLTNYKAGKGYTNEDLIGLKEGLLKLGNHIIKEANNIVVEIQETPTE
jgi:hypothetical protein